MTVDLGVVIRPQSPPEAMRSLVQHAEAVGLEQVWLWEDCFLEGGISSAATALADTQRLTVGIGLLPVPLRNVAATAMEIATLDRMHGSRFRVAVGHGVQEWMEQVGSRAASPMTLMREYLIALRSLLAGEVVTTDGEYVRLHAVSLDWPPLVPTRVLMGAAGPKSLALAGEAADGVVIMEDTSPEGLRSALVSVEEGRARAGRQDRIRRGRVPPCLPWSGCGREAATGRQVRDGQLRRRPVGGLGRPGRGGPRRCGGDDGGPRSCRGRGFSRVLPRRGWSDRPRRDGSPCAQLRCPRRVVDRRATVVLHLWGISSCYC